MAQQFADQQAAGFQNRVTNVAIVGATGTVGKFITESLLATGKHTVTAITRTDSKSELLNGVKSCRIDYNDKQTIVNALKGQDALVITLPTTAAKGTQESLIEAASEAGVKWVLPNEWSPNFVEKEEFGKKAIMGPMLAGIRKLAAKKGLNCAGLSSGFWYPYSLITSPEAYGFDFKTKTVTFIGDGKVKITTSTWAQSGRAVAAALSLPIYPEKAGDEGKGPFLNDFRNKSLVCHSFRVSQRDMLDSVLRVTGDKESDWSIKHEPAQQRWERGMGNMKSGDHSGFVTVMYSAAFFGDGAGDDYAVSSNHALGLPEEDLDQVTKDGMDMIASGWKYN